MFGAKASSRNKRKFFTSVWDTRNLSASSSADNQIRIPLDDETRLTPDDIDFICYWGDGTHNLITGAWDADRLHTYTEGGIYELRMAPNVDNTAISGFNMWRSDYTPPDPSHNGDVLKILGVYNWGNFELQDFAFDECDNMRVYAEDQPIVARIGFDLLNWSNDDFSFLDNWVVTGVPVLYIANCPNFNRNIDHLCSTGLKSLTMNDLPSLTGFGASNIDVSQLTSFYSDLSDNPLWDEDISNWQLPTGYTFSMELVFNNDTVFNNAGATGIGNWNTSKVFSFRLAFSNTSFSQPISNWDMSSAGDLESMFSSNTASTISISGWQNFTGVYSTRRMFNGSNIDAANLGLWPVSTWTYFMGDPMRGLFQGSKFSDSGVSISGWQSFSDGNTNWNSLFFDTTAFDSDLSPWDVSKVKGMISVFENSIFNNGGSTGINDWNTSSVTNMFEMFRDNAAFNQPIGKWDVTGVTNMSNMFMNATAFDQDLSAWQPISCTNFGTEFIDSLSTTNYDLLLSGWAQLSGQLQTLELVNFGTSKYSTATGLQYRDILTAPVSSGGPEWTIQDGGSV